MKKPGLSSLLHGLCFFCGAATARATRCAALLGAIGGLARGTGRSEPCTIILSAHPVVADNVYQKVPITKRKKRDCLPQEVCTAGMLSIIELSIQFLPYAQAIH